MNESDSMNLRIDFSQPGPANLAVLDRLTLDQAHHLSFATRDRLLDLVLGDGRKLLGKQIDRQEGLFCDYFEEDLCRLHKLKTVRIRCSGFIPTDPTGAVPSLEPKAQFRLAFENVKNGLDKMGTSLSRVVNLMVFLKNMDYWAEMNLVYRDYFSCAPARATIGTSSLNLNYQIEVANVVAYKVTKE